MVHFLINQRRVILLNMGVASAFPLSSLPLIHFLSLTVAIVEIQQSLRFHSLTGTRSGLSSKRSDCRFSAADFEDVQSSIQGCVNNNKKMYFSLQILLNLALFTSILFFIRKIRRNGSKHPPGPPGFPIIGNLNKFASSTPHLTLDKLSTTYGPLMSMKLGFTPVLVVSSAKMAEQVMKIQDQTFCSRPSLATQQKLSYNGLDVAFAPYNSSWREAKKLCVTHLFCTKKVQSFSAVREEEVYQMIQEISSLSSQGKVVDLSAMTLELNSNFISRIAFGRRYDGFRELIRDTQGTLMDFCFADHFPCMGWVDKLTGMSSRLNKVFLESESFYERVIEEHLKATGQEDDLVDVLLKLQRQKSLGGIDITTDHIKAILMNVIVGATETSAATVVWVMTELMRNPKALQRVQEEARALMGNKVVIKGEDFEKMVYLKAVLKETMRLHPLIPLLLPRETTQKCTLGGYEIQEKTLVFVNTWTIGRDPDSWDKPEEFVPERFLDSNRGVDFRGQDFELTPFGAGRRICPGMQLGLAMVELTLLNLIRLFDWELPQGMEEDLQDSTTLPGVAAHKKIPLCLLAKNL